MTLRAGTLAGGYEFIDVLDSNPAAVTYKVRNVLAQRIETLRVLPKTLQEDPEKLERLLREVKIQSRISHPNIAQFFSAVQLEGHYLMATELIEGVSLQSRLELGPLPVDEAIALIFQALSALEYAHALGVVHRGISPASLVVTPEGVLKLTSFDLAKTATDPKLTQVGVPIGQAKYMSPEQVKGVSEPDARSDIYALGAVFYELVTGVPPFEAESQFDLMMAQVSKTPRAPSEVNKAVPAWLDPVILAAMAKDPAHRFQTAAQFTAELERWRATASRVKSAEGAMPEVTAMPARPAATAVATVEESRYLGVAAAAAVVVVLLFYAISGFAK